MQYDGRTKAVGVWGYPVEHSRSPVMHNAALEALGLNWAYLPFSVAPENVKEAVEGIRALGMAGVNVTVPLKQLVMPFLDEIDPDAKRIGSVNTIVRRGARLIGYSTDGPGFLWDLRSRGVNVSGKKTVVWGAGGSSRAVSAALAASGASVTVIARSIEKARDAARPAGAGAILWSSPEHEDAVRNADLLVNATPLGMPPKWAQSSPLENEEWLRPAQIVYDLVYVPAATRLMAAAARRGCEAIGGIGMLVRQGALSLSIWMREYAPDSPGSGELSEKIVRTMADSLGLS